LWCLIAFLEPFKRGSKPGLQILPLLPEIGYNINKHPMNSYKMVQNSAHIIKEVHIMNVFFRSISQILKGAAKAFQTFPAAIACALAFAIVTMIRIQLDWPQQEAYNFLFNCLHWAFALGAIFSLTAITAAQSRINKSSAFLFANLLGAAVAILTFLALYWFGGTNPAVTGDRYAMVTGLAAIRVGVAMLVSFIAFIILAGYPKEQSDFARSFFMTHKAFFIAFIYGSVIMSGASGVAGAIQALLYRNMSEKVYMYIATLAGFLAYCIFVGYFPDFRKGQTDERREVAQKQPRFIEILFEYITIPIVLAMTIVLLIWAGKTILTGMGSSFVQLSSIATAYAVGGIWLHVMVTHYETGLAKFYRRIYPIAALVILAFEAWALLLQLQKSGLKITEYSFGVIWIIALAAAVLLLVLKAKAHVTIAVLTCIMAVISVLPVIGYQALPVTAQVSRLENLLLSQNMFKEGLLVPAATEPGLTVRESITDAVNYLANAQDAKLPAWFDRNLRDSATFKAKLGFEQTWPKQEAPSGAGAENMFTSLISRPEAIDISDYDWAFNIQLYSEQNKGQASVSVKGERGTYWLDWTVNTRTGMPNLKIRLDDRLILEEDMNAYVDRIIAAYPPRGGEPYQVPLKDISLQLETPEVTVLLVFNSVEINVNPRQDIIYYNLNLGAIYLKEKS
jgi:hypothetical protein